MEKLTEKKKINDLIFLCALAYFTSYVSRINLSACLVEVVQSNLFSETVAALALTVCSVTYGAGQVISGYLGDRCKPQNLLSAGFVLTAFCNICVGFLHNDQWLVPLWAINGFAQAMMWPPMVAILSSRLSTEDYQTACVRVSWGSSFGTIAVYLLSPMLISVLDIRWVFFISGGAAVAMFVIWNASFHRCSGGVQITRPGAVGSPAAQTVPMGKGILALLGMVLICIILQGFLRDGVTNWTPTFLSQLFQMSSQTAILSGVILPVFSMLSLKAAAAVQKRLLKNELVCAGAFFALGCLAALLLALLSDKSMVVSLLSLAVLVGCMHGVNLMLIGMIPKYFEKYGRVSLVSGILNAGTYVGSAFSAYGMVLYTAAFGWQSTIFLWSVVALGGTLLCIGLSGFWHRFKQT